MAYYPIVGNNSIYNRTTFNTAYLDKTEFINRASFPRHKYEMNLVFVDICDHLTYNY